MVFTRHRPWSAVAVAVAGALLVSCAEDRAFRAGTDPAPADRPVDGRLDCQDGDVGRGVDIEVFAANESDAVALALERWTADGASLAAMPPDESWSAILDGREVAIAYPELNGDGRWTVHAITACAPPRTGPAPLDGNLDCADDASWSESGLVDPTIPGSPTQAEALRSALEAFQGRHGGEIALIGEAAASLVVDDREQVTAVAQEVAAGGWIVTSVSGCTGFER